MVEVEVEIAPEPVSCQFTDMVDTLPGIDAENVRVPYAVLRSSVRSPQKGWAKTCAAVRLETIDTGAVATCPMLARPRGMQTTSTPRWDCTVISALLIRVQDAGEYANHIPFPPASQAVNASL